LGKGERGKKEKKKEWTRLFFFPCWIRSPENRNQKRKTKLETQPQLWCLIRQLKKKKKKVARIGGKIVSRFFPRAAHHPATFQVSTKFTQGKEKGGLKKKSERSGAY